MSKPNGKRGPGPFELIRMLLMNAVAAFITLKLVFWLFGGREILAEGLNRWTWTAQIIPTVDFALLLIPGAAIAFTGLWQWLIRENRRSHSFAWNNAIFYGIGIAFVNVPFSGLLLGIQQGNPLLGLLLAFASLLLLPKLLVSMTCFGLAMGALNGYYAQRWLERNAG